MPSYTDTTPLFTTNAFTKFGRGGAGNYFLRSRVTPASEAAASATTTSVLAARSPSIHSRHIGIGGAGNATGVQDRAFLSVEDTIDREALRRGSAATSWHHGIGGAGNRAGSEDGSYASSCLSSRSSWVEKGEKGDEERNGSKGGADRLREKIGGMWERRNQRAGLFDAWQRKLPTLSKENPTE